LTLPITQKRLAKLKLKESMEQTCGFAATTHLFGFAKITKFRFRLKMLLRSNKFNFSLHLTILAIPQKYIVLARPHIHFTFPITLFLPTFNTE